MERYHRTALVGQCVVQVGEYAEQCGAKEAHVIIFDRDVDKNWRDKIWHRDQYVYQGLPVGVWELNRCGDLRRNIGLFLHRSHRG